MTSRKRRPFSQISVDGDVDDSPSKRSRSEDDTDETCKRAGTIKYMVLKNFMCHSLLEVNFTNNITIIIGKNGSGKSAILTALIVGLGGKASLTNRGKSVKGFVKAGKASGSIEIELCNKGPMAYRPNVFGNCINIIRNLSSNGSGSYRIRSEQGEVISTQAKEVKNITAALNIQVDNPICILNQDTSRNFLSSNDPKHKFTLFMRATRLETLENEYKRIQANKMESCRILSEKEENFRRLQDEIKKLKRKIDNHKSIVNLKDKKELLLRELAWAKVRDVEIELEEEKKNVELIERKFSEFKSNSDKRLDRIKAIKTTINTLENEVVEVKRQIGIQKIPQLDVTSQIEELTRELTNKKSKKGQIQTIIESKDKDIKSLQSDILASNENMSKIEQQKMQRIKDLTILQNKLKGMDNHLETSKNDLFQITSDLSRNEEEEQNLRREISNIDHKIAEEKYNLNAMQKESGNDLLLYGRNMPKLKEMIKQYRNQFVQEPRGPLGSYIKLKDKKWAVAIEGFIGPGTLGAFTVDNKNDNQLLRKILSKVWTGGVQPQIITSKFLFKKHDVSKNIVEEPEGCIGLYNAIEIDDPVVSNCLVDSVSPENILLLPNDSRAQELLSSKHMVPRNCRQGITIRGDVYYPDPNYRTYGSRYHRAQYLQVDTKEYMQQLQHNIANLTIKKKTVSGQLETFMNDMREKVTRKNQLKEKVRKVNLARNQIRRQLEELNSSAEPEVQNIQYLEQELEEVKKSMAEKQADLEVIISDIKDIKASISANEQKLSKLKKSTRGLEDRVQTLKEEIREHNTKLQEISTSDEFDRRRIQEYEVRLKEAHSKMVLRQNTVKKLVEEATVVGERLPDLRQVLHITNDMSEIKNRIERIEMDSENVCDIMDRYNDLSEKNAKCVDIIKCLKSDVNELTLALEKRNSHYKLTESYFVTYMKCSFKKILEYRQFKGSININMKEKKLDLIVMPQHGSQGLTTTSNLSGGERSFSTVAFLYSLWQCMELPFYFLDEFDVYMDKLNRTKVIDILIHHARSKPQLQFVFLTPQDVSFISNDVSILRLEDPERFNV